MPLRSYPTTQRWRRGQRLLPLMHFYRQDSWFLWHGRVFGMALLARAMRTALHGIEKGRDGTGTAWVFGMAWAFLFFFRFVGRTTAVEEKGFGAFGYSCHHSSSSVLNMYMTWFVPDPFVLYITLPAIPASSGSS